MNSSFEKSSVISYQIIDDLFNQIDNTWGISIFGGEPMLFPEIVLYVANICHKKNIIFNIQTNGFWGKDEKILYLIEEKIKPNILIFSLDNFHTISEDVLFNIITFFKDKKTPIMIQRIQGNSHPHEQKFLETGIFSFNEPLTATGRSTEESIENNNYCFCMCRGLDIRPNGDIFALCGNHQGCCFGNIETKSIPGIREKYLHRQPKFYNKIPKSIYNCCRKNELLNNCWDNPNYIIRNENE
jgi:organic radical activating enzyme